MKHVYWHLKKQKKMQFDQIYIKWSKLMSQKNSKELWNEINWKGDADGSKVFQETMPTASDLAEHFLTKK